MMRIPNERGRDDDGRWTHHRVFPPRAQPNHDRRRSNQHEEEEEEEELFGRRRGRHPADDHRSPPPPSPPHVPFANEGPRDFIARWAAKTVQQLSEQKQQEQKQKQRKQGGQHRDRQEPRYAVGTGTHRAPAPVLAHTHASASFPQPVRGLWGTELSDLVSGPRRDYKRKAPPTHHSDVWVSDNHDTCPSSSPFPSEFSHNTAAEAQARARLMMPSAFARHPVSRWSIDYPSARGVKKNDFFVETESYRMEKLSSVRRKGEYAVNVPVAATKRRQEQEQRRELTRFGRTGEPHQSAIALELPPPIAQVRDRNRRI